MKLPPRSLVSLLASRCSWEIPKETHIGVLHSSCWSTQSKNNEEYKISGTEKHPELDEEIKKFMQSTFYQTAPVHHHHPK